MNPRRSWMILSAHDANAFERWQQTNPDVVVLDLPPLEQPGDLINAYSTLVAAIGSGEVSPEQGARVAEVLERKRLAIETASHEQRLVALEEKRGLKTES